MRKRALRLALAASTEQLRVLEACLRYHAEAVRAAKRMEGAQAQLTQIEYERAEFWKRSARRQHEDLTKELAMAYKRMNKAVKENNATTMENITTKAKIKEMLDFDEREDEKDREEVLFRIISDLVREFG